MTNSYKNGYKDGFHLNSKYWQNKKLEINEIPDSIREVLIGCLLGDACMYRTGLNSKVKFE